MKKLIDEIPEIGIVDSDLSQRELEIMSLMGQLRNPNLICSLVIMEPEQIRIQVKVIEIIHPDDKKLDAFFEEYFGEIFGMEENEPLLTGKDLERGYEISGPKWLLKGAIIPVNGFKRVRHPIVMAFYPEEPITMYNIHLKENVELDICKSKAYQFD